MVLHLVTDYLLSNLIKCYFQRPPSASCPSSAFSSARCTWDCACPTASTLSNHLVPSSPPSSTTLVSSCGAVSASCTLSTGSPSSSAVLSASSSPSSPTC